MSSLTFPLKFNTHFVQTTTKRYYQQHTITLEQFLTRWGQATGESDETCLAKWNALATEQQEKVIEEFNNNHAFTINGHDIDSDDDENHCECLDEEVSDDDSVGEGEEDDEVFGDVFGHQKSTYKLLTNITATPEDRKARVIKEMEDEIKALDEQMAQEAEKLKAKFMAQMGELRKGINEKQDVCRKRMVENV